MYRCRLGVGSKPRGSLCLILASKTRSKWLASNPNIYRAASELRSRAYQFQPKRYGQQIRVVAGSRNHTNLPCSCILRQALARFWLGRSRINSSGVNAYPASGTLPDLSSTSFLRGRTGQQRCRIAEQYGGFRIPLVHTETHQLLGLFLLAQNKPFRCSPTWEQKAISGNNLGTITCSRGAYRAYGSDQGLVKTGVISKREVDTVEVRSSSLLVPTIFPQIPALSPSPSW